ncbi:MAG: hypothetical protein SBU_000260 [Candidatus Syntrophoarchaeum butanivorans]|uniref:Uncharacterized protein n=1 Tax=Candidatus Syntropharchaeum butanivorans TaxID=1839936 RepID=A0A1F2P6L3_9EURY|nr:MAG: hypothetical protein SBU_000260 [Candidatus Syntrophoarchaeum butanivorans]
MRGIISQIEGFNRILPVIEEGVDETTQRVFNELL